MFETNVFQNIRSHYLLLKYTTRHVFDHLYHSRQASPPLLSRVSDFVNSQQLVPWLEYLAIVALEDNSYILLGSELTSITS